MRILDQFEYLDDFSEAEQSVIQWILVHKEEVLKMSTHQLASVTFTSPATIVRLCQKLGLKGYNAFKIKLSSELEYLSHYEDLINANTPFKKEDDTLSVAKNLAQLTKDSIDETLSLLDIDLIDRITSLLYNAKEIDLYATSYPLLYAQDFGLKMNHIGARVNVCTLHGEPIFQALNSNKDHCAILISYSGETKSLIELAQILKTHHTPTIAITNVGQNQLASLCDYVIHVSSREKIRSKIANYSSQASIHFILDLLYSTYFKMDYDKNLIYKVSRENKIDLRHSKLVTIDE